MPELDALLDRIGLTGAPEPTLDGLRTLHRAYLSRIPYEDLAVQLGEFEPLDVDRIAARLLSGGRGGYCFELNTVLAWMLERVGFTVERHEAVAGLDDRRAQGPTNHLALVVPIHGRRWLADAGLGEGSLDPLELVAGEQRQPATSPLAWTLEPEAGGGWFITQHPWGSLEGFRMSAPLVSLDTFQPHHRRLSTAPDSNFVRTLILQRPYDDRIVTLRARTLSVDGPSHRERHELPDAAAFAAVLRERFGIDPDALGAQRMERLWARTCAQHEAHVAGQGAG